MLTYPKSTMRVRRMPMHLSSGHVTLMPGKFYPPSNFPQSDLGRWRIHVRLCPKFLVSPPENDSFTRVVFFLQREISKMRGPSGAKFGTMVSTRRYFIMPVQNFGGRSPKNFRAQKHAKFGSISDDLVVRQRISSKRMKIFKIRFLLYLPRFLPR